MYVLWRNGKPDTPGRVHTHPNPLLGAACEADENGGHGGAARVGQSHSYADDIPNFVNNSMVRVDAFTFEELYGSLTSNRSGPLKRPLPALSFGLNYYFAGGSFDRFHYKTTIETERHHQF